MADKRQQKYLHQLVKSRFHIRSLTIKNEKPHKLQFLQTASFPG